MSETLKTPKAYMPGDLKPGINFAVNEGEGAIFPLVAEALAADNELLLAQTINAPEEIKQERYARFPIAWHERWQDQGGRNYFQTNPSESPFAKYSSQGWKLHIAFEKGREEEVSRFLYGAGLFFKTQSEMGTWFNGLNESGSTLYIGSWDALHAVADHLHALDPVLTDGATASANGKTVHAGSGADIEIDAHPKMAARFDVQKSRFGSIGGNGKYSEKGLPSWANIYGIFSGFPLLAEDAGRVYALEREVLSASTESDGFFAQQHRKPVSKQDFDKLLSTFSQAQKRAEQELASDFGKGFILGQS